MTQYELDLQYAKDMVRVRNALHDGTIDPDAVTITLSHGDELKYQITVDDMVGVFATIGCNDEFGRQDSYVSKKWLHDIHSNEVELHRNELHWNESAFPPYKRNSEWSSLQIQSGYDEGMYFQDSLIYDNTVLRNIVLINYLYANPLPKPYDKFIFNLSYFELVLNVLDRKTT
jgi:hypothetical protein